MTAKAAWGRGRFDSELNWGESLRSGIVAFDTCCALDGVSALAAADPAWFPTVRFDLVYPLTRGFIAFTGLVETNIPPLEYEAEYMEWAHERSRRR